jgi:hypothetical protein
VGGVRTEVAERRGVGREEREWWRKGVQDIQLSHRGCRSWNAEGERWKFESVYQSIVPVPIPC